MLEGHLRKGKDSSHLEKVPSSWEKETEDYFAKYSYHLAKVPSNLGKETEGYFEKYSYSLEILPFDLEKSPSNLVNVISGGSEKDLEELHVCLEKKDPDRKKAPPGLLMNLGSSSKEVGSCK